jgi:hypothetical protein
MRSPPGNAAPKPAAKAAAPKSPPLRRYPSYPPRTAPPIGTSAERAGKTIIFNSLDFYFKGSNFIN